MTPPRVRWLAGRDGEAHAVPHFAQRGARTACGLPATDERLTWPEVTRCAKCSAALGMLA